MTRQPPETFYIVFDWPKVREAIGQNIAIEVQANHSLDALTKLGITVFHESHWQQVPDEIRSRTIKLENLK